MPVSVRTLFVTGLFTLAACSGGDDPFSESDTDDSATDGTTGDSAGTSSDSNTNTTTPGTDSGSDSATTTATTTSGGSSGGGTTTDATATTTGGGCAPTPTRYIALGDSVVNGVGVGGQDGDQNGFKMAANYVRDNYAPGVAYENYGQNGAVTTDVPDSQIPMVPVGMAGHAVINIHIGGNDLNPYVYQSDQEALDAWDAEIAGIKEDWQTIWDWAEDPANFPDGATIIMNTQYNPWDDCTTPYLGVGLTDVKIMLLHDYNDEIKALAAMHATGTVADQHPAFLGHGHNYDSSECPHYTQGSDYWMIGGFDFIHAGVLGHAGMAEVYNGVADELYGGC